MKKVHSRFRNALFSVIFFMENCMTAPIAVAYSAFSGIRNVVPCRDPTSSRIRFAEGSVARVPTAAMVLFSQSRQEKQARTPIVWKTRLTNPAARSAFAAWECSFPKFAAVTSGRGWRQNRR